ncbi:MAG: MBL fold metallo-hydrolase, partial [Myxococcota bacterium]|nr:MBL fold metallo-hydrolase [Myxococcota bacterium]
MTGGFAAEHGFGPFEGAEGSPASVGRIPSPTPFPVGDVNAYLLLPPARDGSLTLIDTGVRSQGAFAALSHAFKEYGRDLEAIDRILVTHAHPDHFGQAARLVEASGAQVYASAIEGERMETGFSLRSFFRERAGELFTQLGVPE